MSTNFPTSLDDNTSLLSVTDAVTDVLAAHHNNVKDAIIAAETKLGTGSSTPASGKLLRGTGSGTSAWDKDAPTGTILGTTDTQTITNKTLDDTNIIKLRTEQGYMINGKIVTSVASNNLTVAIKTLAGTDPSSTDPVYVRIGNTLRSITAALSVTKNAGNNWFSAGGTEIGAKETDYFVYLGYNATDGVVIGFARFPGGRVYGDFSATLTNDHFAAISTTTNAAAGDEYENIGRFNAILGVSASYNWSLPATSIVISRPIFETRWLNWTPSYGGFSSAPATTFAKYQITNYGMKVMISTGNGTSNATTFTISLPFSCITGVGNLPVFFYGVDNGTGVTATAPMAFVGAVNRLDLYKSAALASWTGSGNKAAAFEFFFDI